MAHEFSKRKTLVVLAIVAGCFAILWPKIFYPMFQDSVAPTTPQQQPPIKERDPAGALCCGVVFESDASSMAFLNELCSQVLKNRDGIPPDRTLSLCHHELMNKCGIDLEDVVKSDVDGAVVDRRLSSKFHGRVRAQNLTTCLETNFGIDENLVRAKKSYHRPSDVLYPRHMRPERPPHLHPDMMHPALREKGRVIPPTRTIEKQAKPGPMPGMRPPMGGAPHVVSPSQGSGGMGILMPIYTIGIIVFFLYTMTKIMFKKPASEDETTPRIKDFHMDGEHRKYLFAEEYCSGVVGAVSEMSVKEYAILHEQQRQLLLQEQRRSRSKTPEVFAQKDEESKPMVEQECQKTEVVAEQSVNKSEPVPEDPVLEEIEDQVIIPRCPKMDTDGKPIGQWYLPPGFAGGPTASDEENETGSDDVDLNDADERSLRLAFAALKAQKEEEVDQLRRRLEETERAMERICRQMGDVTDKLSTSAVADLLLTPQLSSEKTNEELADETEQECKSCPLEEQVSLNILDEGSKASPLNEPVKIAVLQSSQEIQDPVEEEDFIRTATTESESFLRSFVRRLPSERQPSEMEEEMAADNLLSATSASVVETVEERECQLQIEEPAEENLVCNITSAKEEIQTHDEQSPVEIQDVVEEALKCQVESARQPTQEEAVEEKLIPDIECVEEHSVNREAVASQPHTEEIAKLEAEYNRERQVELKEEKSSLQEDAVDEVSCQPEVIAIEEHIQEKECHAPVEEIVQEIVVSRTESVPQTHDTQEEEVTPSSAEDRKLLEPEIMPVEVKTQEEEYQEQVEEIIQETIASQTESASKTIETQQEEITEACAEHMKESEIEPVQELTVLKEEDGSSPAAEAIEQVVETKEFIRQPLQVDECRYQNEDSVDEKPTPEAESKVAFVHEHTAEDDPMPIEKTVEEYTTFEAEAPVELNKQRTEDTECQLQTEINAKEKTTSELESQTEAVDVEVTEEEYQLPIEIVVEEKTCDGEPVVKSVDEQTEEEECQLQTETIVQEKSMPVAESQVDSVPESPVPESSVPESSVPESSVSETSVPESSVPESSVPESSVPESSVPESSVPESSVPESTQEKEDSSHVEEAAINEKLNFEIKTQIECVQDPVQEAEYQSEIKQTVEEVPPSEVEFVSKAVTNEENAIQIEEAVEEQPVLQIECAIETSAIQEEVSRLIEETPQSEQEHAQEPTEESNIEDVETVQEAHASESECVNEYVQEEEYQKQMEETPEESCTSTVESVQEASGQCNSEEIKTIEDILPLEPELVKEYTEEEECPAQIHEIVEQLHKPTVDSVHEAVKEEESQFQAEETIEQKSKIEWNQEISSKQEEEHKSQMEDTEIMRELTHSEEGDSSLTDGETIEEILESEMESIQDLTVAEDEQTNIEDITEDGLDVETDCVAEIHDMPMEETSDKVEEVSIVEDVPERQAESSCQSAEPVLPERQPQAEEVAIATSSSKLKLEEANVTNARQGSEERKMTVNVCGMDVTACMEDCGKMPTDLLPKVNEKHHAVKHEHHDTDRVISVFLDTAIRPDSHLVVSEAECSAEIVPSEQLDLDENEYEASPVVLSGKMTLSVIGMELNAEPPEIQEEPLYTVEEPDAPRVRFSEPTDRVFLIPVDPEEELILDESYSPQDGLRTEEEDDQIENPSVTYRPPTPPLQHLDDNGDTEFLTYDQLEEVGEVDVLAEEIGQECQTETPVSGASVPESLSGEPMETAICSEDSTLTGTELPIGVDQSAVEALESQIISAEEASREFKSHVSDLPDYVENTEAMPATDEHASIGQMVEKIRVAMEGSLQETVAITPSVEECLPQEETKYAGDGTSEVAIQEKDATVDERVSMETLESGRSIQAALDDMVDSIITESIADSVVGTLRREESDMLVKNVTESLLDRIVELPDSGTKKATLDVEHPILSTSESASNIEVNDFERNREEEEMEHALEQVSLEKRSAQTTEERNVTNPTVTNSEVIESEPLISGFIIREDFPEEDETTQQMTEEEILQARQEIEEIKKLLADVSSGVIHQSVSQVPTGSSNIVTELAYAMAEEAATAAAASKGSSPDMDEYEVIQTARAAESSETLVEAAGAIATVTPTSTDNDS